MLGRTASSGTDTCSPAQHLVTGRELASSWLYPCRERASTTFVITEEEKERAASDVPGGGEEDVDESMSGENIEGLLLMKSLENHLEKEMELMKILNEPL